MEPSREWDWMREWEWQPWVGAAAAVALLKHLCNKLKRRFRVARCCCPLAGQQAAGGKRQAASGGRHADF